MKLNKDEYSALQSRLMKLTNEYMRQNSESPVIDAADEIANEYDNTGAEILSALAVARSEFFPRKNNTPPPPNKTITDMDENSAAGMYRYWCAYNDYVAGDMQLAHFSGYDRSAFSKARSRMRESGYEFEKIEVGFAITKRPVIETNPTDEELFAEFMKWRKENKA